MSQSDNTIWAGSSGEEGPVSAWRQKVGHRTSTWAPGSPGVASPVLAAAEELRTRSLEGMFSKWPSRAAKALSPPKAPWEREDTTARPRSLLTAQGCAQSRAGGVGRRDLGWVGGREEPERGAGRGTKGPFVAQGREKRERITQCPEAMLVTREPFSASLGKQLGAERDRERFNPMGAGTGA